MSFYQDGVALRTSAFHAGGIRFRRRLVPVDRIDRDGFLLTGRQAGTGTTPFHLRFMVLMTG